MKIDQTRKYANHWEWPDKQRKELGIVEDWLESMHLVGEHTYTTPRIGPAPNKAPDCIILDENKNFIAVEVCELVCQKAIEENQCGNMVYRDWQPAEVLNKLEEILKKKDKKKYYGGPYSRIIVLIHTDEPVINFNQHAEILISMEFNALMQVNEAYLLFPYDSSLVGCAVRTLLSVCHSERSEESGFRNLKILDSSVAPLPQNDRKTDGAQSAPYVFFSSFQTTQGHRAERT